LAIYALEDFYGHSSLVNKTLIADTSFILRIKAQRDPLYSPVCQSFLERNNQTTFAINVIIRQELCHRLRIALLIDRVKNGDMSRENKNYYLENDGRYIAKRLLERKRENVLRSALGNQQLRNYLTEIETIFKYQGLQARRPPDQDYWNAALQLMEEFFLDSSDAMILNFGKVNTYTGLATCDAGFNTYKNDSNFHVYMPRALIWPEQF
jgi:hypothetical protein